MAAGADPAAAHDVRVAGRAGLAVLVLTVASALLVPPLGLFDEPAHTVHAAAVVRGELAGSDEVVVDATGFRQTRTTVTAPRAYGRLDAVPVCYAFRPEVPADCAPPLPDDPGPPAQVTTAVGTYGPAWYALVGLPTLVADVDVAVYGMRLVSAVLVSALVAGAVLALRRAGARHWGLVAAALALPPVAVHVGGAVNPSGVEVAAALALWATALELTTRLPTPGTAARLAIAGAVLAVTRPLGPALVVGILVLVAALAGRGALRSAWADRRLRMALGVVGGALVVAAGWVLLRGSLDALSGTPLGDDGLWTVLEASLRRTPDRLVELVGVLGWSDAPLPRVLTWGWLAAAGLLVAAALPRASVRQRGVLALLVLAVLALPIVSDLRSASDIGLVWQGRYTLPVAVGLPLVAGWLVDTRGPARSRTDGRPVGGALAVVALAHVVALLAVGRRFAVGVDGGLLGAFETSGWSPPVPPIVLLGAVAVGLAGLGVRSANGRGRGGSELAARR